MLPPLAAHVAHSSNALWTARTHVSSVCGSAGIEGLAAYLPELEDNWENEADRDTILWAARAVESEPTLIGVSPHLLLVATVPN